MSPASSKAIRRKSKTLPSREGAGRTLSPEFLAHRFQPGQSGNASGNRGTAYGDVVRTARKYAPEAIDRLVELMRSDDERVAFVAAQAILDRAYGKARDQIPDGPEILQPNDPRRQALRDLVIEALNEKAASGR